jgi:GTP-binding protein
VVIGDEDNAVVFEFDPQLQAGSETLLGRRGQDLRLDGR